MSDTKIKEIVQKPIEPKKLTEAAEQRPEIPRVTTPRVEVPFVATPQPQAAEEVSTEEYAKEEDPADQTTRLLLLGTFYMAQRMKVPLFMEV